MAIAVDSAWKTRCGCGHTAGSVELDVDNYSGVTTRCCGDRTPPSLPRATSPRKFSRRPRGGLRACRIRAGQHGNSIRFESLPALAQRRFAPADWARRRPLTRHDEPVTSADLESSARRRPSPARLLWAGLGCLLSLALWALLVWVAIGVGHPPHTAARWSLLVISALAAALALFGALVLATRFVAELRSPAPPRYRGRRSRRARQPHRLHR